MAAGLGAALAPAVAQLCNELTAAGVPATPNPGEVGLPGAWVSARTIARRTIKAATVRCHIYLVVGDMPASQALAALGVLLDQALEVVTPAEPVDTATALTLPAYGAPLPAIRITTDLLTPTTRSATP